MLARLFDPSGRGGRLDFFAAAFGSVVAQLFIAFALGHLEDRISPGSFFLAMGGAVAPLAWIEICAAIRRLADAGWPWFLALPLVPACFWPLWRLLISEPSLAVLAIGGVYGLLVAALLLVLSLYKPPATPLPPAPPPLTQPVPPTISPLDSGFAQCARGHYFNPRRNPVCPYCGPVQ